MTVISLQNVSKMRIPPHRVLKAAAVTALAARAMQKSTELCIRIVDEAQGAVFNQQYRNKKGATNVLAFPQWVPENRPQDDSDGTSQSILLGDLVICAPVVKREAFDQGKSLQAHFVHMIMHGTLHLLGFDHQTDEEALEMELLEIKFLRQMGFSNPYSSVCKRARDAI